MEHGSRLYEPGPSFAGDETPPERLSQMPAWLQMFAATAGDPTGTPAPEHDLDTVATAVTADPVADLPAWLAEGRAGLDQSDPVPDDPTDPAGEAASNTAAALISENDLPEWPRAMSAGDADAGSLVAFGGDADQVAPKPSAKLAVPSVSRAWVPLHERPALSAGATVFALVARETVATTLPASPVDAAAPAAGESQPAGEPLLQTQSPTTAAALATPAADKSRRMWTVFLLALVILIALLVVLVFVL